MCILIYDRSYSGGWLGLWWEVPVPVCGAPAWVSMADFEEVGELLLDYGAEGLGIVSGGMGLPIE